MTLLFRRILLIILALLLLLMQAASFASMTEISVSVASSPVNPTVGRNLTYSVTILPAYEDPDAKETIEAISFRYPVPASASLVSINARGWECSTGNVIECRRENLQTSSVVSLVLLPTTEGVINSSITVSGTLKDSQGDTVKRLSTSVPITTTLSPSPSANDLAVDVTTSPDTGTIGEPLLYSFSVTSHIASEEAVQVDNVSFSYTLPSIVEFASISTTQGSCSRTGATVNCSIGTLERSKGATIELIVTPISAGSVQSSATVIGTSVDANRQTLGNTNTRVTLSTIVSPKASVPAVNDLAMTVSTSPAAGRVGERLLYSFTITSEITSPETLQIHDVSFSYALPSIVEFFSIQSSRGSCSSGRSINCSLGTLTSGEAVTIELVVTPIGHGSVQSSATVGGSSIDRDGNIIGNSHSRITLDTSVTPEAEVAISFSAAELSVLESVGTVTIEVQRIDENPDFIRAISVEYTTEDGSAIAGDDYVHASGVLEWLEGDKSPKTITLTILDDQIPEDDRFFRLKLENAVNADIVVPDTIEITIIDDDEAGTVGFSVPQYRIGEEEGELMVTVLRTQASDGNISVDYHTVDGTATAGEDYIAVSGTLHWEAGDTSPKTFTITILEDDIIEGDETFTIMLTNPTGQAELGQSSVEVVIVDDISETQAIDALMSVARNPVQREMARVIGTLCTSGQASEDLQDRCLDLLIAARSDPLGVADAMQQWAPEEFAAMGHIGIDAGFRQIRNINSRMMTLRSGTFGADFSNLGISVRGVSAPITSSAKFQLGGEPMAGTPMHGGLPPGLAHSFDLYRLGFFVNGHIGIGERDTTERETGFRLTDIGITAGADYRFSDRFIVGTALGYTIADAKMDKNSGSIDATALNIGFYSTFYQPRQYYIDVLYNIGFLDYKTTRRIHYEIRNKLVDQRAKASPSGNQQLFSMGGGYHFNHAMLSFTPTFRMEFIELSVAGFSENMSSPDKPGSDLGVAMEKQNISSATVALGGILGAEIDLGRGRALLPHISLEWIQEQKDDQREFNGYFIHDAAREQFVLLTDGRDNEYYNMGLGISMVMGPSKYSYIKYQRLFGMDYMRTQSIMGGVRFEF